MYDKNQMSKDAIQNLRSALDLLNESALSKAESNVLQAMSNIRRLKSNLIEAYQAEETKSNLDFLQNQIEQQSAFIAKVALSDDDFEEVPSILLIQP